MAEAHELDELETSGQGPVHTEPGVTKGHLHLTWSQDTRKGTKVGCRAGWSRGRGHRRGTCIWWMEENGACWGGRGQVGTVQFMESSRSTTLEDGLGLGWSLSSLLFRLCGHGCYVC